MDPIEKFVVKKIIETAVILAEDQNRTSDLINEHNILNEGALTK